jgi:hypothetical protein
MKAFACIPSYATGIIVAHIVPYAGSHDTRPGRESTWPEVLSGIHFFRLLMVSGGRQMRRWPPGQRASTGNDVVNATGATSHLAAKRRSRSR